MIKFFICIFLFLNIRCLTPRKCYCTYNSKKTPDFQKKSHIWKNWSIFNVLVIFQLILKVLHFFKWSNLSIYIDKKFKNQTNIQFVWRFLVPKIVFWKKHYWVATTTDCFEPIFGFLRQFCFEKHRSATWSRMGMFSELSGRSVMPIFHFYNVKASFGLE